VGFPTTRGSAIAGVRSAEAALRRRSWDALAAAYWRPTYVHVRARWRKPPDAAADLTQAFFAHAVASDAFASYDAARGRFRTFFRVCLDRFVANEEKAAGRAKRGGEATFVAFDFGDAEAELAAAPAVSPDEAFERAWHRSLLTSAVDALRAAHAGEVEGEGKSERAVSPFAVFERYDLCEEDRRPTYDDIARELGIPVTTVTNRLAQARRDLRRIVLEKLAELTASDDELRSEGRALFGVDVA
jgi:DNA-directed RNA polymerase specialized sigma24 family protein